MGYFHEAYIPAPAKISSRVSARSATAVACTSYSLTFVAQLSELQVRGDLFVGGSFVTKKFKPNDIDVAIDLSREPPSSPSPRVAWRLSEDFYPKGLQLLPVLAVGRNYLEWLQQVRPFDCMVLGLPVNHRKGILRVA